MARVGVYDQTKTAFQDLVAPAIHELRGEIHELRGEMHGVRGDIRVLDERLGHKMTVIEQKIDSLDARVMIKLDATKAELVSEIRRVDTRIDGVERELHVAIDIRERLAALEARRVV